MLTRLGASSAHPGGFTATLEQLERFPLPAGCRVLEVGCGTGRTACYLAQQGYVVTGMDLRPEMLVKARRRAEREAVGVEFVQGDICALPFEDASFDIVLAESVTNFASIDVALGEYSRVLRSGGVLYDREAVLLGPIAEEAYAALLRFFGFGGLLAGDAWLEALKGAGFAGEMWNRSAFEGNIADDQVRHPDPLQIIDPEAFMDPEIWRTTLEHDELLLDNKDALGFALFIGKKA